MDFQLSRQIAPNLTFVTETGSTNADLVANSANTDTFAVLVAGYQSAGRGRAGRDWLAPAGSSLFVSVLLKPAGISATRFSWLPLMAGLAMTRTVAELAPNADVSLKWPNDVLVGGNKISGVLSELIPDLTGVVIGTGLNIRQSRSELPIEAATSLALEGSGQLELDEVLAVYLRNLRDLYETWLEAKGDAILSGLRNAVLAACSTVGAAQTYRENINTVRAILPADNEVVGAAIGIDDSGRLIVQPSGTKDLVAVAAGDIVHLRHN